MSEADEQPDPAEVRAELFRALCERTNDLMVQSRIRAAVVELRLQEGVSERPLRGQRAEDPLMDLLLRLLGVGDDVAETELRDPLDVAAERAAWIATREVISESNDAAQMEEQLPSYVVPASEPQPEEHVVIGWQPTEDDLEAFAKELEAVVNDPPPPLGMPEERLSEMVSFQSADAVARAQADARQEALGVYSGPRYPSLMADTDPEADEAEEEGEPTADLTPELDADAVPAFLRMDPVPESAAKTREDAQAPAEQVAEAEVAPVATPPTAPQPTHAVRREVAPAPLRGGSPPGLPETTPGRGFDSSVGTLGLVAAAFVVVLLFFGSAYMGGQRLQAGQLRADVTRAKLYSAIALDENLVRDMVELGADASLLQQRYQQYAVAREPQKARRALALSKALEAEIQGTRVGSVRARQLEQMVQHIASARITYVHSVEEWASATRGVLGGLALTLGFGNPPASDAILPLE